MNNKELEIFVDKVYGIVGNKYESLFKLIIGGCHCIPATEWYGDIYRAFKQILNDDVILDKDIKDTMKSVVKHFSNWFD